MVRRLLKALGTVFGSLFSTAGLALVLYDAYWLLSREVSPLGAGFALLLIVVGGVLLLIGATLLYLALRRSK